MSANSRLTIATHALAWIASNEYQGAAWTTSQQIATSVNTNPVVIRRLLGDLARAGLVDTRQGAGAGCRLTRPPERITLRDISAALGPLETFATHRTEPSPICPVAQGIRPALRGIYAEVEQAVNDRLSQVTLADVLYDTLASSLGADDPRLAVIPRSSTVPTQHNESSNS